MPCDSVALIGMWKMIFAPIWVNPSNRIDVEVLRDNNLGPKDCIVETEYGNVDASLQLRLDNLSKELSLISDSLSRNRN